MRTALIVLLLIGPASSDDEYKPLVTGDDLSAFQLVGIGADDLSIVGQEIRVTGKPAGYFRTRDTYKNYILKFEWKYDRPAGLKPDAKFAGNSGVLIHIAGPDKVWPKSIEVQLANSDAGRIVGNQGAKVTGDREDRAIGEARKSAVKPVGEWNQQEIVCKDGAIRSTINDVLIDSGRDANPSEGTIGWQSEGAPIRFRFVKIKKLD